MTIVTDGSGKIVPKSQRKRTLASELVALKPAIAVAVPRHLDPERMSRICLTALRTTPKLQECTLPSFLGSVLELAQLGLEPNTAMGEAYLIPRKIKGVMQCTIIIGYQGLLEVAFRSGKVSNVYAEVVHDGDAFDYQLGLDPDIRHKPIGDEDAPLTHCYAVAVLKDGRKSFRVLTRRQVQKRQASSGSGKSGPWVTHPEAMWRKTALRALCGQLPRSAELRQAAAIDEAPEYGERQQRLFTEETRQHLQAQGIDALSDDVPDPDPTDDAIELEGEVVA